MPVARYCAEHGLSLSSFYLWRKRVQATASADVPMVEVIAKSSASEAMDDQGVMEIVLPGSVIIRVDDRVAVTRLREVIVMLRDVVEVRS
jgi:hypothetical protein